MNGNNARGSGVGRRVGNETKYKIKEFCKTKHKQPNYIAFHAFPTNVSLLNIGLPILLRRAK